MRKLVEKIHFGLTGLVLAAAGVQFLLAGLGVFGASNYNAHVLLGRAIWFSSLILLVLSLLGRLRRAVIVCSFLLAVLMFIQSTLIHSGPWIEALHPIVGVSILLTAWKLLTLGINAAERTASKSAADA